MKKQKSKRNKTIDFTLEEGENYLERAIKYSENLQFKDIVNKSLVGDTFKLIDIIDDESIDLIIVDPPYNLRKNYHGKIFTQKSIDEYREYTEDWLSKVIPKLKDDGSIYICCDWQSSLIIGDVLSQHLIIRNRISWQREKGRGARTNWKNGMEDIWYAVKSENFTFNIDKVKVRKQVLAPYRVDGKPKDWEETSQGNYRDTYPSNFWDDITIPFWSMKENTAHPTQKPEKLIAKLILASSNEGDLVLDPFMGSGTTSVTAKKLGRKYIGIEQNPLYVAWAEKRLDMADEDKRIQGFEDNIFWERNSQKK